jgi:adenine-specific DNA methylase
MNQKINSNAVYYAVNNDLRYLSYLNISIKSLRKYNKTIKIFLFIYGDISGLDLSFFNDNQVTLIYKPVAEPEYLTSLKWLSLNELKDIGEERLLFVDADTFFSDDIQKLFDQCTQADFYAREEAGTEKNKIRHEIGRVNLEYVIIEKTYHFLLKAYKTREMPFFNTGVMLFNHNIFKQIPGYLSFYQSVMNNFINKKTPYPSKNTHMLEEVVTNFMLGKIENFTYALLSKHTSPFYLELREKVVTKPGIVMHIWGHYYPEFIKNADGRT